jgi:ATP-dependent phosphoenolpyruvate carboxykinase
LLHPRQTWADKDAYDAQAAKLAAMFAKNFEAYAPMSANLCSMPRRDFLRRPNKALYRCP